MSTTVEVYSVSAERLRAVPGSKDRALQELAKSGDFRDFFQSIDQLAEGREDTPPTCLVAYKQILAGSKCDPRYGYVYGYAYEAICRAMGIAAERPWHSIARSFAWFEEVDKALELLAIPLKVLDLVTRGPLMEIPEPDDFPGMGSWTPDEIALASEAFSLLELKMQDESTAKQVADVAEAIEDIRSWIQLAVRRPGDSLVGIHS